MNFSINLIKAVFQITLQLIFCKYHIFQYQKRERTDREEFARRRPAIPANDKIDLNDVEVLKNYVTEYGKIIPARVTGVTSMQQRQIKKGVRRARNMGLMA